MSAVVVLTFVGSIGGLYTASKLVSKGVEWQPILKMLVSGMPSALAFTIPISVLTSVLLVFGRLSADSEITAIKACGISLWKIVQWMIPVSLLLTGICLYVNSNLVPYSHFIRRSALTDLKSGDPTKLIEEGRLIDVFDGLKIIIGKKDGRKLEDIHIYDMRTDGKKREIKAKTGVVSVVTNSTDLILELNEVTIDPFSFERPGAAYADKWKERINNSRRLRTYNKKVKDLSLAELYSRIKSIGNDGDVEGADIEEIAKTRMKMSVEINKRLALSCSCFAFMFLGIPFGIRSHRKESSIGIGFALALVFVFYLFVIIAEQLASHPKLHPDILTWVPVVISLLIGSILINRQN
jgi:lipopolysaccharide export system permease protein